MNQPVNQPAPQPAPQTGEKLGSFNPFLLLGPAIEIATAIAGDLTAIQGGQPVSTPPIRTYIAGKHVEIAVSVNPLP